MDRFTVPPQIDVQAIGELVTYAWRVVEYFRHEHAEAEDRGLEFTEAPRLIEGWTFVATALTESYGLPASPSS